MDIKEFGITSDEQLINICKELDIKLNWIGFEEDLPEISGGGYILNIGNDRQGTHWVCINVEPNKKEALYFDSFAVPPSNEVIKWLSKNKLEKLIWNSVEEFQQLDEQLCGIWCVVALWYMQHKKGTMMSRLTELSYDF